MPDRNERGTVSYDTVPFFLSQRQAQTLAFAAQGLTTLATAQRLVITERTVRKHLRRARARLGAVNTTHAVALAMKYQLIEI